MKIDILVNNAACWTEKDEFNSEMFRRIFGTVNISFNLRTSLEQLISLKNSSQL
jgi:hypothetical protein